MNQDQIAKLIRISGGVEGFSPISYFTRVSSLLSVAPLEEWKTLVPQLWENTADLEGLIPKNAVVQRIAARQLAILIFAAEQLQDCKKDLSPKTWREGFEAMLAEFKKGPPRG